MEFPIYVLCGYRSYSETDTPWTEDERKAMRLVKAVKGLEFKGFSRIGGVSIQDNPAGRTAALALAANFAARKLIENGHSGALVAVPSSSHISFGDSFTGSNITEAIARQDARFKSRPILRFRTAQPKSSKNKGSRDPAVIAGNLVARSKRDFSTCILVDDVKSSGGHLKGAARFLNGIGIRVEAAFCVAETMMSPPPKMFDIPVKTIDASPETWDF